MRWDQLAEVETNNLLLTSVAGREGSASTSRLGTGMVSALGVYRLGYTSVIRFHWAGAVSCFSAGLEPQLVALGLRRLSATS